MLFNSPQFLFCFLPAAVLGFALLGRFGRTAVVAWLAFMSLVFYAYWRLDFLALLVGSIAVNYACSRLLWRCREQERAQRLILILGVIANLAMLAYFKYLFPLLHFLTESLGLPPVLGGVILPLGISFFTFTQIAYLVDLSQDSAEPQDFVSYVLFVTFFPHLIAGPILHHSEIMPQFLRGRDFSLKWKDLALGLSWFILGLGKKVLIADRFAPHADAAFAHAGDLTMIGAWVGVLNYALQLYFDFSGYSDMAIGLARMFSIEFPYNFDSPYKAAGIIEFWSRWHMTLTRYLTLYLYNPFAMSINRRRARAGKPNSRKAQRTLTGFLSLVALPTVMTMFIAGIWHGAGLQFIVFGLLHGIYLTINHAWRFFRREGTLLMRIISPTPVGVLLTFAAVLLGQIFFRAASTHQALQVLAGLFGRHGVGLNASQTLNPHAFLVFALLPVVWFFPNTQEILGRTAAIRPNVFGTGLPGFWRPNMAWAGGLGALLVGVLWFMTDTSAFLYFQF
jgi:D-alanyl-lipoteichoic acid acyltransferase DltB (MBOAT superfamily)